MKRNDMTEYTSAKFVKYLKMIHLAMGAGQILFAAVVLFIGNNFSFKFGENGDIFFYVAVALALMMSYMSPYMYKLFLKRTEKSDNLKVKLDNLKAATIIRFALLEGGALFAIVISLMTNNYTTLVIAGILILIFFSIRPSREKISDDLNLNMELQSQFNNEDEVIS